MSEENLWGNLPTDTQVETPASILKAQGVLLTKMTKGVLEGRTLVRKLNETLVHDLRIVVPTLSNYSVSILRIQHGISLYPLHFYDLIRGVDGDVLDAEEFRLAVKQALQSEQIRNLIAALLAQAKDEDFVAPDEVSA